MKIKKPFVGIIAFTTVLLTMPLGHAFMIAMEKTLGDKYVFQAALILGFVGLLVLVWGMLNKKNIVATLLGLVAGLMIWTGWIEFAFVYFAHKLDVQPLIKNGEEVTKPEYLIMPSSIGFWAVVMIYYFLGTKTGCTFFNWFQKRIKISSLKPLKPVTYNPAIVTFMEINMILWTFYLLLLFVYDDAFMGDQSIMAHVVAYSSLLLSLFLFTKLIKKQDMAYAIRYAIPTVIIFWNFVEILGRWDVLKEIWVEPFKHSVEMLLFLAVIIILLIIIFLEKKLKKKDKNER